MFGGTEAQAMPTAVAIEMIHTLSLIHDDLPAMDDDDMRRGAPTNHVIYGDDVAILAGDSLLSTSFEHCADGSTKAGVEPKVIVECIRRHGEAVGAVGLAGGQVMDLECEAKQGVTLDEYLAASGVAVPRPHELVNSSPPPRRPPRSPPRTPSPPERKAQRRHSPIPADASAGQIRAYHRRQALSPARQRTVRTQSFRALPNCPYKSSDRRREHLRRIMLNA